MITSCEEFIRLRNSLRQEDYRRASNDEASISVWNELIDLYPEMREWVAHNKTVPIEILEILAFDVSSSVRAIVAGKRKLSEDLFEILSLDSNESVRLQLARNKKAPKFVLERLSVDSSFLVSGAAIEALSKKS